MPKLEELRDAWFNAPDLAAQKKIGAEIQLQAFEDVPYYPLGLAQQPTAFRQDITGVPEGFVIFWNVRRLSFHSGVRGVCNLVPSQMISPRSPAVRPP